MLASSKESMRADSSVGLVIGNRFREQRIEFARGAVAGDLFIPLFPIPFGHPVTKLRELARRELPDLFFDCFEFCHSVLILRYGAR
jgi:hypothetical protein